MAADSGWREVDGERVAELEAMILDGNWGATALAGPTLMSEGDAVMTSSEDGGLILFNGKHIICALHLVAARYSAMSASEGSLAAWVCPRLESIFKEGMRFEIYQFRDPYDRLRHMSIQALAHEQEQNKLYNTTLAQKAQLVKAYWAREGKDWAKARDALVAVLGSQKLSTVSRWVTIARDLNEAILLHLSVLNLRQLAQAFVVQNKYLVGRGEEARFRLSDEWAKVALTWYKHRVDAGAPCNSDAFVSDFCVPAKHAESWERAQVKVFGVVATGFRAFTRAVEKLQVESGRQNILRWLRDPDMRKRPNFGLDELTAMVDEMLRTKAGTNKADPGAGSAAPLALCAGDAAAEAGEAGGPAPMDCNEDSGSDVDCLADTVTVPDDPVVSKANSLAEAELAGVSIHTSADDWADEVKASVYPTSKSIVYVECPTSRAQVFHNFLKLADKFPAQLSVFIPVGARLDMLGSMQAALQKRFPKRSVFAIQLSVGKQSSRIKPGYALYVPMDATSEPVSPAHVELNGCRATSAEGIRLRCVSSLCPMRDDAAGSQWANEDEEIPLEDQEAPNFEECFEQAETTADDDIDMDCDGPLPVAGSSAQADTMPTYVVNLWPCAAPIAVHARILADILRASQRTHMLLLTRSAHPGMVIAARDAGLKVIALLEGVSKHSAAHGAALLKSLLIARKMSAAKAIVGATVGEKRLRNSEFQFVVVTAADDQPVRIRDIEARPESAWRGGFNKSPTNLEQRVMQQLQKELDAYALGLEKIQGEMHIVTKKSLREGDLVGWMSGLTFDSLDKLSAFVHSGESTKDFINAMVRIDNIQLSDDEPPTVGSLYHVLTGFGRLVKHYQPLKKSPNTVLHPDPGSGPNDGLLTLVVKTRNKCGIAQGTPLVLNYGSEYDHDAVAATVAQVAPKRLRGMLDQYFAKLGGEAAADASAEAGQASASGGQEGKADQTEDAQKKDGEERKKADEIRKQVEVDKKTSDEVKKKSDDEKKKANEDKKKADKDKKKADEDEKGGAERTKAGEKKKDTEVAKNNVEEVTEKAEEVKVKDEEKQKPELFVGEVVVKELTEPFTASVVFRPPAKDSAGTLGMISSQSLTANKKLPPNLILYHTREGRVVASQAGWPKFGFTSTKKAFVCERDPLGKLMPLTSLHTLIQQTGATGIAKHGAFKGEVPADVTPPSGLEFVPQTDASKAVLTLAAGMADVEISWIVKLKDKIIVPMGVVVHTKKQLIMPAVGRLQFK